MYIRIVFGLSEIQFRFNLSLVFNTLTINIAFAIYIRKDCHSHRSPSIPKWGSPAHLNKQVNSVVESS